MGHSESATYGTFTAGNYKGARCIYLGPLQGEGLRSKVGAINFDCIKAHTRDSRRVGINSDLQSCGFSTDIASSVCRGDGNLMNTVCQLCSRSEDPVSIL